MNIIQIVFIAGGLILSLIYWSQPIDNGRESPPPEVRQDEKTPLLSSDNVRQRNLLSEEEEDDGWSMV